jgi:hypothetical protein
VRLPSGPAGDAGGRRRGRPRCGARFSAEEPATVARHLAEMNDALSSHHRASLNAPDRSGG